MSNKKSKPNLKQTWGSLTDIGLAFGLFAIQVGAKLKEIGVRGTDGKPTQAALDSGMAKAAPTRQGFDHYMWNKSDVKALLREHGLKPKCDSNDPAHPVALEIWKTIKDARRLEEKGEDKMGLLTYVSACEAMKEALKRVCVGKRLKLAARIFSQLESMSGEPGSEFQALFMDCPVSFEAVEASISAREMERRFPFGEMVVTPRGSRL